MSKILIKAEPRETIRKRVNQLRNEGLLPGVLYGGGKTIAVIQMPAHETSLSMRGVFDDQTPLTLELEGKVYNVVAKDVQRHPLRREIVHIDFQTID